MSKTKNNKKQNPKEFKDEVCPYASKEEEDEFLNFSDDDENSESVVENEISNNIPKKKAYEVDMPDTEMTSDEDDSGADDDKISDDEYDMSEEEMDDASADDEPFDRNNSRELTKFYAEQNERTVFVGNITPKVTSKVLTQLFNSKKAAGPGAVETVRIRGAVTQEDSNNRNAKRRAVIQKKFKDEDEQILCAFVVLKKKEDVEKCLQLNNHEINGKHIRVDMIRGKKMSYKSNNSIFIGNLPYDCNEEQVRQGFSKCGEIVNVRLVRSKLDGKTKGFGYIEFTESMGVDFSMKMKDHIKIGDRSIRIEKWSGAQTQQQKRKIPAGDKAKVAGDSSNNNKRKMPNTNENKGQVKKRKINLPTNMRSLEVNEYIRSKSKKMNKKIQKKRAFTKDKKAASKE